MKQLVPDDSDWELQYVEVAADEVPEEMEYGYLIEAYVFENSDKEVKLMCNIESPQESQSERKYEVYVYKNGEQGRLLSYRNRGYWCDGIAELMRSKSEGEEA